MSVFLISIAGCGSFLKTKPSGEYKKEFLVGDVAPIETTEEVKESLKRSDETIYPSYYTSYYLHVSAIPESFTWKQKDIEKYTREEAYKRRWDEKKTAAELQKAIAKSKNSDKKMTCFEIEINTNGISVGNSSMWHGDLISGNFRSKVTFTGFYGWIKGKNLTQFSTACSEKPIDFSRDFSLVIMPRYIENIKPITLTWGKTKH